MKILFDSSYFMPLIRVEVNNWSSEQLYHYVKDHSSVHEFYYSELSLFEIAAKGTKIALNNSELTPKDIQIGIDSLQNYDEFSQTPLFSHPYIFDLAHLCRKIHNDFIDCLIFSSAVCYTECFSTYDHTFINKIINSKAILNKIKEINPKFMILFDDLKDKPKLLNLI